MRLLKEIFAKSSTKWSFAILVFLLSSSVYAQTYIDYVHVYWTEQGQSKAQLYIQAGSDFTLNRDSGTSVTIRIFKTDDAPSPATFYTMDQNNAITKDINSSASYVDFQNSVGAD